MAHCPDQEVSAEALLVQGIAFSVEDYSIEHPWGCLLVSLLFRLHVR